MSPRPVWDEVTEPAEAVALVRSLILGGALDKGMSAQAALGRRMPQVLKALDVAKAEAATYKQMYEDMASGLLR